MARSVIERAPNDASQAEIEQALIDRAPTPNAEEAALHYGHWSAMGAYALSIVALAAVSALRPPGWRLPAWGAGTAATVYGVASLAAAGEASAALPLWAVLSIVWGIGFIVLAERERDRSISAAPALEEPAVLQTI